MNAVLLQHHLRRAADFLEGVRLTHLDDALMNSSALLAIHSAISYSDALRVGLGDDDLSADDHSKALDILQRLLPAKRITDRAGLAQLQELISQKSSVAYGSRRLTPKDVEGMATRAERFARWANSVGKLLKIEGWRND